MLQGCIWEHTRGIKEQKWDGPDKKRNHTDHRKTLAGNLLFVEFWIKSFFLEYDAMGSAQSLKLNES